MVLGKGSYFGRGLAAVWYSGSVTPDETSVEQEIQELLQRPMGEDAKISAWALLQRFRAKMLQTVPMRDGEAQRSDPRNGLRDALMILLRSVPGEK